MPNDPTIPDFAAIVGAEYMTFEGIAPANADQLAAVMSLAHEHFVTLRPRGGATKFDWGNSTSRALPVSLNRISGIREHIWQDMTATVAAGTTWSSMQESLAAHGQQVALDPYSPGHATVGGVLATNDSGLLRARYGSLRDLVLGITVVLADGTIARSGGKVVKNVAGYDLAKLFIGSFGTLGVITEVTFRLHPKPQHTRSFTIRAQQITALANVMSAIVKASLSVERMQLRTEPSAFALDVELASLPDVIEAHTATLHTIATAHSIESSTENIWQSREQLFADPVATILKITCLPTKLAALVGGVALLAQLADHTAQCVADPVGIVTAAINAPPPQLALIVEDLRLRLLATGGAVVVLRRGALPDSISTWGPEPAAIDVMHAIKQEFDPHAILNRGIFAGGI